MKTFDYRIVDERNVIIYLNGKEYKGIINSISYFISLSGQYITFLFDELGIKDPISYYESILGYIVDKDCCSPKCKSREDLLKVLDQMKKDFPAQENKLIGKKVHLNQEIELCKNYFGYIIYREMHDFLSSIKEYTILKATAADYQFKEDKGQYYYPIELFSFIETNTNNKNLNNYEIKFQNSKTSFTRGSVPAGHPIRCRTNKITITSGCLGYSKISFGS